MNKIMDLSQVDELIAGYFNQELSKEDQVKLQQWIKSDLDNKLYFLKTQEVWFSSISANHSFRFDSKKAFQRFLAATINIKDEKQDEFIVDHKYRFFKFNLSKIAASVAILVVFSTGGYFIRDYSLKNLSDVKIEAPYGSKTKMYLPDGSLVWLNAGSSLSYNQNFGINNRKIKLVGEAYFEVTKNKTLPFSVHANQLTVQVLGTKFNFRNYSEENEASVTLLEGKVNLDTDADNNSTCILTPNQKAIFDKNSRNITINNVRAVYSSEWTKGIISFDEEKLVNIAKELERLYNVKVILADTAIQNYRFYGNFSRSDQNIQDVLNVFVSTQRIHYKQNGNVITLSLN